eukprot:TRINITY_DN8215_c0_g1_i1.p1 TRINITY_DN8215_c0_g1~~TRINITY_DN8215_c0_g1_i1.p1  ORF type:complete len:201 (+),score=41.19 TRINITY_DN8215_c0_g1_i1:164-766(+)
MEKTETSLITKLIDLYLSVKIRSEEDLDKVDEEGLERERKELARANPLVLVDYIRASIEILLKLREERRSSSMYNSVQSGKEVQEDYEEQIQKLEAETRMHIRVEQQLKLHVDSIQAKLEEYEKTISKLTKSIKVIPPCPPRGWRRSFWTPATGCWRRPTRQRDCRSCLTSGPGESPLWKEPTNSMPPPSSTPLYPLGYA